jgi:hypothetical protein
MTPLLLALAVAVAAPGPKDAPSLVGTWALDTSVTGGMADYHPPGVTWTFTADGKSVITVPDGRAGGGRSRPRALGPRPPRRVGSWFCGAGAHSCGAATPTGRRRGTSDKPRSRRR